jgi:CRISPR-associated protein Csb2
MSTATQVIQPHLLIAVRFHDGRYHGAGDHPPAPARLFQALVAGVGLRGSGELKNASPVLEWIEKLPPPIVAIPFMAKGQRVKNYVPNNDLDAKGGDPSRIGEIRTDKTIQPSLFDCDIPLLYIWELRAEVEEERKAWTTCDLSECLYQFGRGVDMAWAWGEVLDGVAIEERLRNYPGQVFRPSSGGGGTSLPCPTPGSLASLVARHAAGTRRFSASEGMQLFAQQPKPRFARVAYESPPSRHTFELRMTGPQSSLGAWPLPQASKLVVLLRDAAVARLSNAMPGARHNIERFLVGRKPDREDETPSASRIKIVPMPSIGHQYADHGIRRVFVEVPASCPLRSDDVRWAFSGLDVIDHASGEVFDLVLTPSTDGSMLSHYCATDDRAGFRVWRTVTPAALPEAAKRRRIDPARAIAEAKGGCERAAEQERAAASVSQALRHAQINASVDSIRVQREPFTGRGDSVEAFAAGTRFDKRRLWHVEITFGTLVRGPLVIGDGRFLGLGVLAPLKQHHGVYAFVVNDGLVAESDPLEVARALRRAVMARVQAILPWNAELPTYFSGHEADGSPARSREHIAVTFDAPRRRLLVVAPHLFGRRAPTREEARNLETLELALHGFSELRSGAAGLLKICATSVTAEDDPLFAASRTWESVTPYQVTRHLKHVGAAEAFERDLRTECRRRGLPEVRVTPFEPRGIAEIGLVGGARLDFRVAVNGPIILGRSRHFGGGLFAGRVSEAT